MHFLAINKFNLIKTCRFGSLVELTKLDSNHIKPNFCSFYVLEIKYRSILQVNN